MSHPKTRIGILGTGYIAEWHAAAINNLNNATIVAVCDLNEGRAENFAQRHGTPDVHSSLEAMLSGNKLDVIHVLLPPQHHFAAAKQILEAPVNVFLEKPMCVDPLQCEELLGLAERGKRRIGVNHNFLFTPVYEQLRSDVRQGLLGQLDHVGICWAREIPQLKTGQVGHWMFAEPENIMLEIAPHSVAHMLDLAGLPDQLSVQVSNPVDLPGRKRFYRRWQAFGLRGETAVDMHFSFDSVLPEQEIRVRGSLGVAIADLQRNTYTLRRFSRYAEDCDRYHSLTTEARSLRKQAQGNILRYALGHLKLSREGNAFAASIAKSLRAFYAGFTDGSVESRNDGVLGRDVVATCTRLGQLANIEKVHQNATPIPGSRPADPPRVLVIGGSGFIGRELVRQLSAAGHTVRILTRSTGPLPFQPEDRNTQSCTGTLEDPGDLDRALEGISTVYHLAVSNSKTWDQYFRFDVLGTRLVAERCLAHGVKRLIYTGTIASYYAGSRAGTITEETSLDPKIDRRIPYARAKAMAEGLLMKMHRERGLPVVIFRPGVVIGTGGSPYHNGVGFWSGGAVCQLWGTGKNKLPIVLVEDVASAMVKALDKDGIDGESFNLVGDPCLSAREYLAEIEHHAKMKLQVFPTSIWRFYLIDTFKWLVKVLVRHHDRYRPMYRDWESRTQRASYDCTKAKGMLGWAPVTERDEIVSRGILVPLQERLGIGSGDAPQP